jgi:hypothetical protein
MKKTITYDFHAEIPVGTRVKTHRGDLGVVIGHTEKYLNVRLDKQEGPTDYHYMYLSTEVDVISNLI